MAATLTWTQRARYTAVAPNSVANAITAIVNAVNAGSYHWVVSASAASYVELKANPANSPTGDLASARILIFGSVTPNAGALNASVPAGTTQLYACLCVDASTTGPVQLPSVGDPYTGKTRKILGEIMSSSISGAASFVNIVDSADVIHIGIGNASSNVYASITAGRCVVDGGGTARWAVMGSGQAISTTSTFAIGTPWVVTQPPNTGAGTQTGWSEIDSAGTIRSFGMAFQPLQLYGGAVSLLTDGTDTYLIPVHLARSRTSGISTSSQAYYGTARQMKFGPAAVCGQVMTVGGITQAIAVGTDLATGSHPCWFSQA